MNARNESAIRLGALLALSLVMGGCAKSTSPMAPRSTVLRISPANGAQGVRLDAPIVLTFGAAVDRGVVESGLHLVAEPDMYDTCPDPTMGSHGSMDAIMNDPDMLRHMSESHGTAGHYAWNDAGTMCTFEPDSLMQPDTRYMVHMSGDMLRMMESMGGGMMDDPMNGAGDMMVHFQTMSADGHSGHHGP